MTLADWSVILQIFKKSLMPVLVTAGILATGRSVSNLSRPEAIFLTVINDLLF
jgi:hypothetical protein